VYRRRMRPRRRRAWIGFALAAAIAIAGLFVIQGPLAGVATLVAMLAFIGACIHALSGEDPEVRERSDRVGLAGWIGGWF
jgi:hypothetical protein